MYIESKPSVSGNLHISKTVYLYGGYSSVRITGADADVCGVGLGVEYDGGVAIPLPASSSALIVDGAHAAVHKNYINGAVVVSQNSSDSRIGDTLTGNGDGNDGVRDASITVLADATSAAQRVTIRDPFSRALFGLAGNGIAGGDDVVTHTNNWAQTPTIVNALTFDNFATTQVMGTANPFSLVDIYFDTQVSVTRQTPVMANAAGDFVFIGELPGSSVTVIAASTLSDTAHLNRVGSTSRLSSPKPVTVDASTTIQLAPPTLSFTAIVSGSMPAAQSLFVTVPPISPTLQWQTSVTTTSGSNWLSATVSGTGSGMISVAADPTGLASGTYTGTVTVADIAQPSDRASSAVTLVVQPAPPTPTPINAVSLSGPMTDAPGTSYSFSADISPVTATQPITYIWQATGQTPRTHTNGLNDATTFNWPAGQAGNQTITLTAMNASSVATATHDITLVAIGIVNSVAPEGQIKYRDQLTYTLVVFAPPGADVAIYDSLDGPTFAGFVERPSGITQTDNIITGSLTATPTQFVTVTFVAQATFSGTVTSAITNRACVRVPSDPLSLCTWSNQTSNAVSWPYSVFLPIVIKARW
jgi:hypothetical protein